MKRVLLLLVLIVVSAGCSSISYEQSGTTPTNLDAEHEHIEVYSAQPAT